MPTAKTGSAAVVVVSVPARADVVHVIRAVVGGTAALHDAPFDIIEDLRLSADEACAFLLTTLPEGDRLTLAMTPSGSKVEIEVASDAHVDEWPPARGQDELAWYVLTALAEDAAFVRRDGSPAIRFTLRLRADD